MKKGFFSYTFIMILISLFTCILASNTVWAKNGRIKNFAPAPEVIAEFDQLQNYISELLETQLAPANKTSLVKKLDAAESAYKRGNVCTSANILNAYLNHTNAMLRAQHSPYAEDLRNRGQMLQIHLVLSSDERCSDFQDVGQVPDVQIFRSDNLRLSTSVSFGRPVLGSVKISGEIWTQLEVPKLQSLIGEPGMPAIPTWHTLVAVPRGAEVHVLASKPEIQGEFQANIYPFQPQTSDAEEFKYSDQSFEKNSEFYQTDVFYPTEPCSTVLVGNYRGLNIAQLTCSSGQYNPKQKTYRSFENIEFEVLFEGGDGSFITSRFVSPFEQTNEKNIASVLNKEIVKDYVLPVDISDFEFFGEELLILTHPDFRTAADKLAEWKKEKGIITNVFEVGTDTSYDTGEEIDDLIEYRYENNVIRPSYILLLGDVEYIPPARTDHNTENSCGSCGDATNGSDYAYAMYPHFLFDIFPDFAVGRISVDTISEAQRVVDKIVTYESEPPFIDWFSGEPFYTTAANAAEFQGYLMAGDGSPWGGLDGRAQRSFTETSELVRDELIANGYTVQRIYRSTEDPGGYCIDDLVPCTRQQPYTGDPTPDRYRDGSLLPADLRAGSGFAWDGDTNDIIDAFNEGRFLILHRDHGSTTGWGTPSFRSWDFGDLENDELLPVVYSVNCASGFFDQETDFGSPSESFMELLLIQEDGGMVGGLGDNRNSPTWANSALTRGFYDATWPNIAPEFGEDDSIVRLGDILNHGKIYLLSQIGVDQTAGEVSFNAALGELIMWHAYGDPSMEIWTGNPYKMILTKDHWSLFTEDQIEVGYPVNNAWITAYQTFGNETVPIGRAVVENGIATIPFFQPPVEGVPIILSASMKNAVSVLLTSQQPLPDLEVLQLADEPLFVIPGQDLTDILTVVVGNLGEAVASGTVYPDGTIKPEGPGYMIDLVLSEDTSMPEGW